MEEKDLLTLQEAADYLGFQVGYLKSLIEDNVIPYYNPVEGVYYFSKQDLNRWIRKKSVVPEDIISVMNHIYTKVSHIYDIQRYNESNFNKTQEKLRSISDNNATQITFIIILVVAAATVVIKWL